MVVIGIGMVGVGILLGCSDPVDMNDFYAAKALAAALLGAGWLVLYYKTPPEDR